MKTILILMSMVSSLALANSEVSANRVIAQVASVDAKIASVKLLESGTLAVTMQDKSVKSLKLSESNREEIFSSVQELGDAELTTETHVVVCMMMIAPFSIQNLSVLNTQSNKLNVVLSSHSCALSTYTHPKEDYLLEAASTLKAQLVVLARQLVNN